MADTVIGVVLEALLGKVVSLAAEEISLSWNVKKQLTKLAEEMEKIQALLCYVQSNHTSNPVVRPWLKELPSLVLDAQIVLDEFGYEILRQKIASQGRNKVRKCLSLSHFVVSRPKIAHKIKDVLTSFEEHYKQSIPLGLQAMQLEYPNPVSDPKEMRLTVPFVEDSKIVGREDDISKVIHLLIHSEYINLPVVTILGMGGQGKTTLAQLIYKDEKINRHFEKVIWVCVSDDFSVERVLGEMLQSLTKENHQLTNAEALVKRLEGQLRGKRYLLVLDDVWSRFCHVWNSMRACLLAIGGLKDSKILATTRSEDVASAMETSSYHRLQELSEDESWSLFEKCAFGQGGAMKTPQLVEIGKRILRNCRGVPLAIRTIGGLLYSKSSDSEWLVIERSNCWSMENDMVLSTIKLSYDHLPLLSIKQCFAFCAFFEKDTRIEKDNLIRLWMAQGLLNVPRASQLQMEEIGENYFHILLRNSLLQDVELDDFERIRHCKMHDLVHDVSLQVSEDFCYQIRDWKTETNKIEAVHVSINSGEKGMWKSLKAVLPSKLQTLRVSRLDDLSEDFFQNFKYLSVLIVDESDDASELPNSIGEMKHLRFLDIAGCRGIKRLPESFTKLYYLQTLLIYDLEEVPNGFENLINLRHIEVKNYQYRKVLFKRLSQLKNLQTLPRFGVDKKEGCQIEEMEHLDNLRGELSISDLQNVGSYESATLANLSNKVNIQFLQLKWDITERDLDCDDSDVVEGLKPHSNLKSLSIYGCQISKFPSWMVGDNNLLLLQNLVSLSLEELNKCERLPSLGHLPFLKVLTIVGLHKVKCIEKEFYTWPNLEWVTKSPNCNNNEPQIITLFPALRSLVLIHMDSLVEWSDGIEILSTTSSSFVQFKVFPYLENLYMRGLPKLSILPNVDCLPSLRQLFVQDCENVRMRNVESSEIIGIDDESHSGYFPSLRQVYLWGCHKLIAPILSPVKSLLPLESLHISCYPNSWPKDLHHLCNLRELRLAARMKREEHIEYDCYPWPYPKADFVPLKSLTLVGSHFPKVTCLPHQIQYLTALTELEVDRFEGLETLPEWLGNLECLQILNLLQCENLKQLPSVEAFQRLTSLQYLWIDECPLLENKCRRESGSEWIKIAHIPHINISD